MNGSSPTAITNLIRGTNSILYRDTTGKTGTTNGTTALLTATAPTWNAALRNGLAWSGTGRSLVFTGGAVATDANAVSNGGTLYLGSNNGSAVENGWYQSFAIYNQRLPDATLQAKRCGGGELRSQRQRRPLRLCQRQSPRALEDRAVIRRLALAIALLAALPAHAVEIIGNASSWATYAKAAAATGLTDARAFR